MVADLFPMPRRPWLNLSCVMTRWKIIVALAAIGSCSLSGAAFAEDERVDLLLVLASDVSRGVDDTKFKLQREGHANAIVDPRVVHAMTTGPHGRIAISFV